MSVIIFTSSACDIVNSTNEYGGKSVFYCRSREFLNNFNPLILMSPYIISNSPFSGDLMMFHKNLY